MLRHRKFFILVILGLPLLSGCTENRGPNRADPPIPTAAALPAKDAPAQSAGTVLTEAVEKRFEGITLTIPAGWEERPVASEFIQAEYRVSGEAGPARMTLSSAGGSVEANLERWQGQFQRGPNDAAPERDTVAVDGVEATIIELNGTFTDGFSKDGPQRNWCMLGAIIPTGPANFFLKLTGPRETVAAHRDEFREMVKAARLGK
ncbi:MAG: hypothetical protein SFV23_22025 [Planctomycetaceae bacterium]|nr:hypothetical protein [Planctomycetaceae bacterium]